MTSTIYEQALEIFTPISDIIEPCRTLTIHLNLQGTKFGCLASSKMQYRTSERWRPSLPNLIAMASTLEAMASNLLAMASTLEAMAP